MSQKCNTLLCGKNAVYKHSRTGEQKCEHCRDKRGDKHSLAWINMVNAIPDFAQPNPPKEFYRPYTVCRTNRGYLILEEKEGQVFFSHSEQETEKVCEALNNAFKLGANYMLLKLSRFSLDQRRSLSIVWGDGNNNSDH